VLRRSPRSTCNHQGTLALPLYDSTLVPPCLPLPLPLVPAIADGGPASEARASAAGLVGRSALDRCSGLSLAHICTQPSREFYAGGRLARLRHPNPGAPGYRGDRGICSGFSHASRIRCMQKLAMPNHRDMEHLPVLITLTYPGDWSAFGDDRQWKAHLRAFRERLQRKYGKLGVCWKLEFQKRGAPHFHLLCYFGSAVGLSRKLRTWVSRAWYEVVGSGQPDHLVVGTNVRPIHSVRQVASYVSKYVAKLVDDVPMSVGRWWGVWNWSLMPVVLLRAVLSSREFYRLRRVLLAVRRSHGSRMPIRGAAQGIWLFLEDDPASAALDWAIDG
jgi:hypothetical protein